MDRGDPPAVEVAGRTAGRAHAAAARPSRCRGRCPKRCGRWPDRSWASCSQMSGVMFGGQVGQGLGALAQRGAGVDRRRCCRLASTGNRGARARGTSPHFGEGLGIPDDQVRLYLALRECAHVRLFHHAPWLTQPHRGGGGRLRAEASPSTPRAIEQALGGIDPSNPQAIAELMSSGVFEPPDDTGAADRARPARGAARTGRGMGRRRHRHGGRRSTLPALRRPARDDAPPPRVRWTGRADLRDSGRPTAATPPTPRGRRVVAHLARAHADRPRRRYWDHPDLLPDADDLDDPEAFVARSTGDSDLSALEDAPPPANRPRRRRRRDTAGVVARDRCSDWHPASRSRLRSATRSPPM